MKSVTINSEIFGELNIQVDNGMMEDYILTIDGKEIDTTLDIGEDFLNENTFKIVEKFIENVPLMYKKAKERILDSIDTNEVVRYFIDAGLEDMNEEELLEIFSVNSISEISKEMFAKTLEPRRIGISPYNREDADGIDCVFDFSLNEEYTDQLLVLFFDEKFEVYDIWHES